MKFSKLPRMTGMRVVRAHDKRRRARFLRAVRDEFEDEAPMVQNSCHFSLSMVQIHTRVISRETMHS